ncbi:hypothetical protein MYX64_09785 [Nitrospinae bacterium AH_259_B05_G02_I21]|nr:hypothetical protein [Nitrospinae bacterium AH_259_B05_G02_I21]MDA2931997.1 hypothetical protein [Nitrospinae bacterium AH-259-F20]
MKKSPIILCLLSVTIVFAYGCTVLKVSGRAPHPVALNNTGKKFKVISHFEEPVNQCFDYTMAPDLSSALSNRMQKDNADGIVNLGIKDTLTFGDGFLNCITGACVPYLMVFLPRGLTWCHTTVVEGDTVRYLAP